ncbi:MAG: serine/threonine protein phosphatase [Magnetococcales bacterium]|nr:serine/threonine protein phosphatase [Magnetococcales bacterium]
MFSFLQKIISSSSVKTGEAVGQPIKPFQIPSDNRLYVIGDIHGRLDLLINIQAQIEGELEDLPPEVERRIIYLGDYIDRGPDSRGVIDRLLSHSITGCEQIFLKGNHESELESFLLDPQPNHTWTQHGGMEMALSYDIKVKAQISAVDRMRALRDCLLEAIPPAHLVFFSNLRLYYEMGDYFMVHAGVRPGVPLNKQKEMDLLWIREPFLSHKKLFEKRIVHGHTVTKQPIQLPNQIGIDTGACYSGVLSCLVLEAETVRFLTT